jgi:hypothetical protein
MTFSRPTVRLRKFWFLALAAIVVFGGLAYGYTVTQIQIVVREQVSEVQLVTEDIPRFWKAFDQAQTSSNPAAEYQQEYLEPGTVGLQDFARLNQFDAAHLAQITSASPNYFRAIRKNTLAIAQSNQIRSQIKTHFENLKRLYPAAQFQDMYFVIGALNSGGTVSENGLLLGAEMNARDKQTPITELSPWLQANTGSLEDLPFLITHEEIHTLQYLAGWREIEGGSLLWKAIQEGGADFLASLATNEKPRGAYFKYGLKHEHDLWQEFSSVMNGTDISQWIYNGDLSTSRPADLGYFIGYRILEAYYNRMPDKQKAIAEMLSIRDPEAILKDSGYNP